MSTIPEVQQPWTKEQLESSEDVSKKQLTSFLLDNASQTFLKENKLNGKLANIVKSAKRVPLIAAYVLLFETKAFKDPNEVVEEAKPKEITRVANVVEEVVEVPKYSKQILKKGDGIAFPKKGSTVGVWYSGRLEDGTVFDEHQPGMNGKKKRNPLSFKAGTGRVIRGWDEALMTMSKGEKAKLTIEPEWGYGKKGNEPKIPPNATLIFEVELLTVM